MQSSNKKKRRSYPKVRWGSQKAIELIEEPSIELPTTNLKKLERQAILIALHKNHFIQKYAARDLGISERVMTYKINRVHKILRDE